MATGVPAPEYPSARYAWYVTFVLFLALTVSFIDRQILSLMVQPVRADLGLSDTGISLLHGAAFTLFYVIMGVPLGRLADRSVRQRMIVIGIVLWSCATIACGFANSFATLFAARMLVGVGEAALSPAAYSMIADLFARERRARAMALYSLGPIAGTGLALILGGQAVAATSHVGGVNLPIVGHVEGWQAAFIIVGLPGLVIAALLAAVREPVRRERHNGEIGLATTAVFLKARALPLTLITFGIGLGGSVIAFGFGAWLPTAFVRLHGWTTPAIAGTMGLILLTFGLTGAVGAGFLADRITARGRPDGALLLILAGVVGIIPAVPIVALGSPAVALVAYAWLNLCLGPPTALAMPTLQGIVPNEYRGQVAALYLLTITLIGLGIGPTLIAIVTDKVFVSDMAIGKAMALVLTLSASAGLALLLVARRSYKNHITTPTGEIA